MDSRSPSESSSSSAESSTPPNGVANSGRSGASDARSVKPVKHGGTNIEAVRAFPKCERRISMYVGQSRTGKTHLALVHASRETDGRPTLIIDSMGADNFSGDSPHRVATVSEAVGRVFGQGGHAIVTPWSDDEGDVLFEAAADLGHAHIIIDESSRWLSGRTGGGPLARLLRAASHRQLTVKLTTQHFSADAPAFLFNCEAAFYLFRTGSFRARARLAEEFEEPDLPDLVKDLPDRVCVRFPR